jgi:hypothetical protein
MREPSSEGEMSVYVMNPPGLQEATEPGPETEVPASETIAMITETTITKQDIFPIICPDAPIFDQPLYPFTMYESNVLQDWRNLSFSPSDWDALTKLCVNCPETDES